MKTGMALITGILMMFSLPAFSQSHDGTGHQYHGGHDMHQGHGGHDKQGASGHKGHGMKEVMKYADVNEDGEITHEEFMRAKWAFFNHKFQRLDQNGDGMVSHREFMEFHRDKGEGMFRKKDANGDGVITKEEREQAMEAHGKKDCPKMK